MECMYTAQGVLVCNNTKEVRESFMLREDPNENTSNQCSSISKSFSDIAAKNSCDSKVDINACTFDFTCKKPDKATPDWCSKVNKAFNEISGPNSCSMNVNQSDCSFSFACQR